MKKLILLLVLIMILSGCQPTSVPDNTQVDERVDTIKTEENEQPDKGPVIRDEKAVLEAFDALAQDNVDPVELNAFLMDHISNLGIDSANYALVAYVNQIMNYGGRADKDLLSPAYQLLAHETFDGVFSMDKLEGVNDRGFVDAVEDIYSNGMSIEYVEGYYVPVIDFERLFKNYGNEIGEDIKAFLDLVQVTLKDHISVVDRDGMNHVAKLIVEHDKYLKTYPNSMVIDEVREKRDWLREVYFLESTCSKTHVGSGSKGYAMESFKDVIQFYPGTELERMTQDFITIWSQANEDHAPILKAFVKFYDQGIVDKGIILTEGETVNGLVYPKLSGTENGKGIEVYLENKLNDLWNRYDSKDMVGWELMQDYEVAYIDQKALSVVFYVDLVNPVFPSLSIRDMEGHTFDLETGEVMDLEAILPTEDESIVHLIADLKIYASRNEFDMSGVDGSWMGTYVAPEGVYIYKSGIHTGHDADRLLVPTDQISEWVN